ncbi:hypothetical protein GDO81_015047 [Engystomops pustulosus]|nr:hypothetical protein GDO81_015047 [Engystomops pustulosus]KAG8560610.1 hypothetical protein GDO81_015047 [Engystomops pustulosus]
MVMYVCFFKGATKDLIPKMVSSLVNVKLSESDSGKHVSITELREMYLCSSGYTRGKVKGPLHAVPSNAGKEQGMELYAHLTAQCQKELETHARWSESGAVASSMGLMEIDKF